MKYYPLYMNVEGQRCLVVGAGTVAERKARSLLRCGARVTVIGEDPGPALRNLAGEHLVLRERRFRRGDLGRYALVFGATDDPAVNEALFREGRRRGIPVNVVDDPGRSTFIVPAVYQRGDLTVAVSTAGKSPAAARMIKEDLGKRYGKDYADLVALLGSFRELMMKTVRGHRRRAALWRKIIAEDILGVLRRKGRREAARLIEGRIGGSGKEGKKS